MESPESLLNLLKSSENLLKQNYCHSTFSHASDHTATRTLCKPPATVVDAAHSQTSCLQALPMRVVL